MSNADTPSSSITQNVQVTEGEAPRRPDPILPPTVLLSGIAGSGKTPFVQTNHAIQLGGPNDFSDLLEKDSENVRLLQDYFRKEWRDPPVQQDGLWDTGMCAIYRESDGISDLFNIVYVLSQAYREHGYTVVDIYLPNEGSGDKHVLACCLSPIPDHISKLLTFQESIKNVDTNQLQVIQMAAVSKQKIAAQLSNTGSTSVASDGPPPVPKQNSSAQPGSGKREEIRGILQRRRDLYVPRGKEADATKVKASAVKLVSVSRQFDEQQATQRASAVSRQKPTTQLKKSELDPSHLAAALADPTLPDLPDEALESDPALLDELGALLGSGSTSTEEPAPEPICVAPPVPSRTAPSAPSSGAPMARVEALAAHYTKMQKQAEAAGESAKARRHKRALDKLADIRKQIARGQAVAEDEWPVAPPGMTVPAYVPETGPFAKTGTPGESRNQASLEFLLKQQAEFKRAAVHAKTAGNIELAKKYLVDAKGFESMIKAAQAGLPVSIKNCPVPPQQHTSSAALQPRIVPQGASDTGLEIHVPETGPFAKAGTPGESRNQASLEFLLRQQAEFKVDFDEMPILAHFPPLPPQDAGAASGNGTSNPAGGASAAPGPSGRARVSLTNDHLRKKDLLKIVAVVLIQGTVRNIELVRSYCEFDSFREKMIGVVKRKGINLDCLDECRYVNVNRGIVKMDYREVENFLIFILKHPRLKIHAISADFFEYTDKVPGIVRRYDEVMMTLQEIRSVTASESESIASSTSRMSFLYFKLLEGVQEYGRFFTFEEIGVVMERLETLKVKGHEWEMLLRITQGFRSDAKYRAKFLK